MGPDNSELCQKSHFLAKIKLQPNYNIKLNQKPERKQQGLTEAFYSLEVL
jgi:hypothetical protein